MFVDHALQLMFSIRFGIAVSLVVRLVRGRGAVGGEALNVHRRLQVGSQNCCGGIDAASHGGGNVVQKMVSCVLDFWGKSP